MNVTETERTLLDLPSARLRRLLIQMLHEVTVHARETYGEGGVAVAHPAQLREFNESMHRLTAALRHCDQGKCATAVEMVTAQIGDFDPIAVAVGQALSRAMAVVENESESAYRSAV